MKQTDRNAHSSLDMKVTSFDVIPDAAYLVTEGTLFCTDVSDEVPGLFGHLVQKHVTQRQTAIPYVMALWWGKPDYFWIISEFFFKHSYYYGITSSGQSSCVQDMKCVQSRGKQTECRL